MGVAMMSIRRFPMTAVPLPVAILVMTVSEVQLLGVVKGMTLAADLDESEQKGRKGEKTQRFHVLPL